MQPKVQKLLISFFGKYQLKTFAKGEKVIKEGNNKIFLLTKGVVRMHSLSNEGVELTLNIYKPHSLFPMSVVVHNKDDGYTYDALSHVEGYFAPKKEFEKFIKNNPSILFDLLKRIYRGLEGFFQRLESLLRQDANLKILNQLIIHAKRFGQKEQDKLVFDWHLTHVQLASQTGLARESVTREIKKLQDKGLIGYTGKKLFIYDFSKLEEEYRSYIT